MRSSDPQGRSRLTAVRNEADTQEAQDHHGPSSRFRNSGNGGALNGNIVPKVSCRIISIRDYERVEARTCEPEGKEAVAVSGIGRIFSKGIDTH